MLNLFLDESEIDVSKNIIRDVEAEAVCLKLTGSDTEREILYRIDKAEYLDEDNFKSRTGIGLGTERLSTGCKAALCVVNTAGTNNVLDTCECGVNAVGAIISLCRDGNILIYDYDCGVTDMTRGKEVEVRHGKYVFHTVSRLNYYLINEVWRHSVDLDMEGVAYVEE